MSVKSKKESSERVSVIHRIIEQEEAINYEVNYCEVNFHKCVKMCKKLIILNINHA